MICKLADYVADGYERGLGYDLLGQPVIDQQGNLVKPEKTPRRSTPREAAVELDDKPLTNACLFRLDVEGANPTLADSCTRKCIGDRKQAGLLAGPELLATPTNHPSPVSAMAKHRAIASNQVLNGVKTGFWNFPEQRQTGIGYQGDANRRIQEWLDHVARDCQRLIEMLRTHQGAYAM